MLIKVATIPEIDEYGFQRVLPFGRGGQGLEKYAGLPDAVQRYVDHYFKKEDGKHGILVTAMGAGEYWGSNSNGDLFHEKSLLHLPSGWSDDPDNDKVLSKGWPWGLPTFYNASSFAHHVNKDPSKSIGDIGFVTWDPHMHWVLAVVLVDEKRAAKYNGGWVLERLASGKPVPWSMGCFPAGTRVLLSDGSPADIEMLRVGDRVLNSHGQATEITEVHPRPYVGHLWAIKPYGRPEIRATEEHPFLVLHRADVKITNRKGRELSSFRSPGGIDLKKAEWVRAKDLKQGDFLLQPANGDVVTPDYATPEIARLLGYYTAEGHLLRNKKHETVGIELTVGINDAVVREIGPLCLALGTANRPNIVPRRNSAKALSITIFDRKLAELCKEHVGTPATEKRLSESLMCWDPELQKHLLGTFLNGDGHQQKTRRRSGKVKPSGRIFLSTASEQLAHQLTMIAARCGMIATINTLHHHPGANSVVEVDTTEYQISIGQAFASSLKAHAAVREVEAVTANQQRIRLPGGLVLTPIQHAHRDLVCFSGTVYNFEVSDGESYTAEGVAVHNCRVPFDLSSITPDYDRYEKAWADYDPKKHKSPADAILSVHDNVKKIVGLSRTRKEYPDELLYHMNEVQSDGRKIYAINDFPTFFDLSAVGVPADQVAWSIMKLGSSRCELRGVKCAGACHRGACRTFVAPGAVLWERLEEHMTKAASLHVASLGKGSAVRKAADIDKEITPAVGDSSPLSEKETEIPKEVLDHMGKDMPLSKSLSTPSMMGMILRPREFRRIMLGRMGKTDMADRLDDGDVDLPFSLSSEEPEGLDADGFDDILGQILQPLMGHRSCLGPVVHRTKIIIIKMTPKGDSKKSDEEPELQRKISSLYNGYRGAMISKIASAKQVVSNHPWLRDSLYGLDDLPSKVGSMTGSLVPLVTQRTMDYLRAV
jgi:hypothetical protein